jgi:hypothetical protein
MAEVMISLMVPISSEALKGLTADEIIRRIVETPSVARLEESVANLEEQIRVNGRNLELILNEVDQPMEKARALRDLAQEMKQFGRQQ